MKINDFFFSAALDTLEIGHVLGGAKCSTGSASCSSENGTDSDGEGGDTDTDNAIPATMEDVPNQP